MASRSRRRGVGRREILLSGATALLGVGVVGSGITRWWEDGASGTSAALVPPPTPPTPTPDYQGIARSKIEKYLRDAGDRVTVAVRDQVTGLELTVGKRRFQTASIVKVDILAALLLHRQEQGKSLTSYERNLARPMIVLSDNNATTSLYQTIGYRAGLTEANKTLGLKETKPNASWGMTTTTAADQLRLLKTITDPDGPLTEASRKYLLGLMGDVDEAQDWGITAAAGEDATASYVKNGWDTIDIDNGLWQVNSIGRIIEPDRDWLIAVLSDHHASQEKGIKLVERVAKYTLNQLRPIPAPEDQTH
ncbi:serine hydrolase [Plantactinospora sonchi]|uniref:Serine hydrolase n=1 Tax=Plantactinospora sonchi TaxID=1544735 RepID=A0ABU7RQ91_9ACTN